MIHPFIYKGYDFSYYDDTQLLYITYNQKILTKFDKIKTRIEAKGKAENWIDMHTSLFKPIQEQVVFGIGG